MKRQLILALVLLSPLAAHAVPITWTGDINSDWNNSGNWSPMVVPGPSDDVTIGNGKSATVSSFDFANTVTCTGTLNINGSLRITSTSSFTTLNLLSGAIAPGSTATITGPLTMAGGSIVGSGNVTISGVTTVTASGSLSSSGTVTNSSTITIMGNGIQLSVGAVFSNSGTVNIQGDSNAGLLASGGTINNSGTIAKTTGAGVSILQFTNLNNSGTVSAGSGTLQVLGGSGTETGAFNASSGAILDFALGNLTLSTGTTFGGTGTVDIFGGIWTLAADVTVNTATFQLDGGSGFVTVGANNLTVNSPTVTWNSGDLGSSGSVGQVTLSGATVMTIVNSGQSHTLGRNLDFTNTVKMNADLTLAANITIEPGATFNVLTDSSISGNGTINNGGLFEKTGGTGISNLSFVGAYNTTANVSTRGAVMVTSGILNFAINGTSLIDGNWINNSVINFTLGTYNVGTSGGVNTFVLSGSGSSEIEGATWNVQSEVTASTNQFFLLSGTIQGSHDLTVDAAGGFSWLGGSMQGPSPGSTTIPAGITLTMSGSISLSGRTMNNMGTANISTDSTVLSLAGATWNNEAGSILDFAAAGNINDGGGATSTFNNDGTVQKTAGSTSQISFNGQLNNNAMGKIIVNVTNFFVDPLTGTSAGSWTVASGASLAFFPSVQGLPSTWTINKGTTMTGQGTIDLFDTVWNLNAPLDIKVSTTIIGGTSPHVQINGPFDLTLEGKTISFVGLTRTDGTIKIPQGKSAKVSAANGLQLDSCTFDSSGKFTVAGSMTMSASAVLLNETAGKVILDAQTSQQGLTTIVADSTTTITNNGILTLGTDSGAVAIQTLFSAGMFNNAGTVSVPAGRTLNLAMGTGASTGLHTVTGTLTFQAGAYTLNAGTTLSGGGTINLGGTWMVTAPITIGSTVFQFGPAFSSNGSGGVIQGNASLTISSKTVNCEGGSINISSPGVVTLAAGSICNSDPNKGCTLAGSAINILGKLSATSGNYSLGVGTLTIQPGGSLDFGDNFGLQNGGAVSNVINQGTVEKLTGTGTATVNYNGSFTNGGGTVDVESGSLNFSPSFIVPFTQSSGTTKVANGATLSDPFPGNFTINGGSIGGIGSISGPINNAGGSIAAGTTVPGILALNDALAEEANSIMNAVLGGTTPLDAPGTFDQINSTSSMALGGTLNLSFLNGFSPTSAQSFNILNFASSTGSFSSVVTPNPTCTAKLTTTSTSLSVSFTSSNVSVTINPPTVTLKVNTTQQFTDTVTNGCGNGVTWKVKEGAAGGKVTQKGLYTAPGTPGTFHVVVTSVADPTKRATATVTVTTASGNQLSVTPHAAVLQPGASLRVQANSAVNWAVVEGVSGGSITSGGTYSAPSKPGLYHVLATSAADSTQHAVVNIAVVGGKLKSAYVADLDGNSVSVLTSVTNNGVATGQLKETESVSVGRTPMALAISPDGRYLLSANHDSNDVSVFTVSQADGVLGAVSGASIDTGTHPSAIAIDSAGRLVFVVNQDSDDLSVFSMNAASGQMVLLGKQALATGDQPSAIAVHPGGSLIFVTNSGSDTVAGFSCDAAGLLSPINGSPFTTGSNPSAAVVDAAGKFLFVANGASGNVSVFAIDTKNKTLQEVGGSPFAASQGAAALALDVTDSYLFVAGHEANDVAAFQIDGETGALTLLGHTSLQAAGPSSLAVDPSGQYLYLTSDKTSAVTTLRLDVSTGQLAPASKATMKGKTSSIVLRSSAPASIP